MGSFKLFGKHHFWDFLEKLLDDQLEKSNDGSFSVEKQSAKYNLCRAVAIIADIKLMEKNNDMRLRAFICYGMNVQACTAGCRSFDRTRYSRRSSSSRGLTFRPSTAWQS